MKRLLIIVKYKAVLLLALIFSLLFSPIIRADYVQNPTYFQGAYVDANNLIRGDHLGSNSLLGSIMPNWHSTKQTYGTGGAGAVGTRALGIHSDSDPSGTTANNTARKQALFCFLQNKNGVSSASRHSSCTGLWETTTDWERMGSAVIVHQMLGRSWGAGSRSINSSDWGDLYDRLVMNTDLRMLREDHNWDYNSAGVRVGGAYDAVKWRYTSGVMVDSWVFRVNGAKVYALEVICANPLGDLPGLPPDPQQFSLTPSASINKSVVELDDSAQVTHQVTNSGADPSDATLWRLTRMQYSPATSLSSNDKAGRDSASDPCGSFTSGGRSNCSMVQESTDAVFNAGATRTFNPVYTYNVPDSLPVGTKVCFTSSVSRPTQDSSPVWRHSSLQCIIVGKKPKIQVWGGDVRTGSKIETSTSSITANSTTYGSWGEYGALSVGSNNGFASGSGLNNGNTNPSQSSWDNLTFANTGNPPTVCDFGCYDFTLSSAGLISQFTSNPSYPVLSGSVDLNSLATGSYQAADLVIAGSAISAGKSIVIVATGTVTIEGNIAYQDSNYTSIRDIPQVVIRAPVINIRGSVTQIDSWLLAVRSNGTGRINTCSDVSRSAQLSTSICSSRLTVNGPVIADSVYLRRTAGSESQSSQRGDPAEVFNLRADAYLWAKSYGSGTSRIQTVHSKELAPRF